MLDALSLSLSRAVDLQARSWHERFKQLLLLVVLREGVRGDCTPTRASNTSEEAQLRPAWLVSKSVGEKAHISVEVELT